MKKLFFALPLLIAIQDINAQTEFLKETGSWYTFTNKVKLSNKLYVANVSQMRRVGFVENIKVALIRPSLNYKLTKNVTIGAGYLFFRAYPNGVIHASITKDETRFWQHITLNSTFRKMKLSNRFMFEARFKDVVNTEVTPNVINGASYTQRIRYRLLSTFNVFKLKNDKFILGKVSNEIRIGFKTGLSRPNFDQNNFYAYLGYQVLDTSKVWIGFGRNYFKKGSNRFLSEDVLHLALSYDFDLTKKK